MIKFLKKGGSKTRTLGHGTSPDNSHLTAIVRNKLSAPARWLRDHGQIRGRVLDYGCGRGFDARELKADKYDPFFSHCPPHGKYDTILCTYVLNVIPNEAERSRILNRIKDLLNKGGHAYISVRRDTKKLKGWTKWGTWQGLIALPLEIVEENSNFIIYELGPFKSNGEIKQPTEIEDEI